jgi:hypothetical protein
MNNIIDISLRARKLKDDGQEWTGNRLKVSNAMKNQEQINNV